jgi:subtilisin family serine protease
MFIAGAGNDHTDTDTKTFHPSGNNDLDNVISVAATDPDDSLTSSSNYGINSVDLAAPGYLISSTIIPSSYGGGELQVLPLLL